MAGSTTATIPKPFHNAVAITAAITADEITYRVTIDIPRIQANVLACEGGRLSELAVRNWLRSVGFTPEAGGGGGGAVGGTWLADAHSLRRLDKSEIVRAERVRLREPDASAVARNAS